MKLFSKRTEIDMVHGPLLVKILTFSFPVMLTNLLQVFYNAADMMVVGLSSEPDAVGAIGTTTALTSLIVNLFAGFAVGANVVVARHIGAGRHKRASEAVHTALCMSLIFGLLAALTGLFFSKPILLLMGIEGKLLDLAATYTRFYFLAVPFLSLTNYTSAILRAKGDAQTPLTVLSFSGLFNVISNLIFVLAFGLSVEGVALATLLANIISATLLLRRLYKDTGDCRFSPRLLRIEKTSFLAILHIGLPSGIQSSLFAIPNILIQSSVIRMNDILCPNVTEFAPVVKGNSAAQNLGMFVGTTTNSIAQACVTFTSQNVGAKKTERVYRVLWICVALAVGFSLALSSMFLLLRDPLFSLYGVTAGEAGSPQRIAYDTGVLRLLIILLPYAIAGFMEMCSGVAKGLGKAVSTTVITLIGTCALRVVWIYTIFDAAPSLLTLYVCYPVTWALTGVVICILVLLTIRHLVQRERAEQEKEQEQEKALSPGA